MLVISQPKTIFESMIVTLLTRKASCLIQLPKMRTEFVRNSFYYMGEKPILVFQLTLERYLILAALAKLFRISQLEFCNICTFIEI